VIGVSSTVALPPATDFAYTKGALKGFEVDWHAATLGALFWGGGGGDPARWAGRRAWCLAYPDNQGFEPIWWLIRKSGRSKLGAGRKPAPFRR